MSVEETEKDELQEPGYRSSRRTSKARKRRRVEETKGKAATAARTGAQRFGLIALAVLGIVVLGYLAVVAVNGVARWNAARNADTTPRPFEASVEDNAVIIGVQDGDVEGFLALGLNEEAGTIVGIGVPGGAFMEVPGQGFQRVEDSLDAGADISTDAISNYLGVRFDKYAIIDAASYQAALQGQDLSGVLASVQETNMSEEDLVRFGAKFDATATEDVVIVPLPVRPISLGDETYFEPQIEEVLSTERVSYARASGKPGPPPAVRGILKLNKPAG